MRPGLLVLGVALFVGHGGQPLAVNRLEERGAGPRPAPHAAANADAARFLAAARGADPVICALAVRPVGNRWGGDAPLTVGDGEAGLLDWALEPSIDDGDLNLLEAGLRDPDGCVRAMSARLLAADEAGPAILMRALADPRTDTRRVAAAGLGHAEYHAATAVLIDRLGDDDAAVRTAAAWALGRLH